MNAVLDQVLTVLQVKSYDELKSALTGLQPDDGRMIEFTLTPALAKEILNHDPVNRALRPGEVTKYARTMLAKQWSPYRSFPLAFLPDFRLGDGQHRCHAVVESGVSIVVRAVLINDTYGVDAGAQRTLLDYLTIGYGFEKRVTVAAASITRALCKIKSPSEQELVAFFDQNRSFILECAEQPLAWLSDREPVISRIVPPKTLSLVRAKSIFNEIAEDALSPDAVDDVLLKVVNSGVAGGYSRQIYEKMNAVYEAHGHVSAKTMLEWVYRAVKGIESDPNQNKNIITAKSRKKKKKPAA